MHMALRDHEEYSAILRAAAEVSMARQKLLDPREVEHLARSAIRLAI
jgi:hypothetical protein